MMQGAECRSGALEAPRHALAGASQVLAQGDAEDPGVENNGVLGYVGEWPHGGHARSVLCEPVCRVPRHTEGARSPLARVKLGARRPPLRGVPGIVAQDVALAGVVADRGDRVPAGPRLIPCDIIRRVPVREDTAHL